MRTESFTIETYLFRLIYVTKYVLHVSSLSIGSSGQNVKEILFCEHVAYIIL